MHNEIEEYLHFFDELNTHAIELLDGLPPEALNWQPVETVEGEEPANSLAAVVAHMAGSQKFWVAEVAGGRPVNRDRPAEFRAEAASAAELQQRLREAHALLREMLPSFNPDMLGETVTLGERRLTRRNAVIHALEHASVHVGHMEITRQLWQARAR